MVAVFVLLVLLVYTAIGQEDAANTTAPATTAPEATEPAATEAANDAVLTPPKPFTAANITDEQVVSAMKRGADYLLSAKNRDNWESGTRWSRDGQRGGGKPR